MCVVTPTSSARIRRTVCAAVLLMPLLAWSTEPAAAPDKPARTDPTEKALPLVLTLPAAAVGRAFRHHIRAEGGSPPYQFMLQDDGLRGSGISLSASGELSGKPGRPGSWVFTVAVQDASSHTPSVQTYRLRAVKPRAQPCPRAAAKA